MKICGYVVRENEQPNVLSDYLDCDSVEEYVDTIISLIIDSTDNISQEDDMVLQKLHDREYEVELDCDGEEEYIIVTVRA